MGVLLTDSDPKRAENEYTVPQKEKSPDPGYFNLNYENQRNEEMQPQPQGFQVGKYIFHKVLRFLSLHGKLYIL